MALLRLCALALPVAAGGVLSVHRPEAGPADQDAKPHASPYALMKALQRGDFSGDAAKHVEKLKKLGDTLTQDVWMASGPEALAALKGKVVKSSDFTSKVSSRCQSYDTECSFNKATMLFCDSLELAATQDKFGDMDTLEKLISATTMSTRFYGVDTVTQSALIARWTKDDQDDYWTQEVAAGRAKSASFSGLRSRILESDDVHGLIAETCKDLSTERPECKSRAKRGIFCQALGQAASVMLGATEAGKRVNEALRSM